MSKWGAPACQNEASKGGGCVTDSGEAGAQKAIALQAKNCYRLFHRLDTDTNSNYAESQVALYESRRFHLNPTFLAILAMPLCQIPKVVKNAEGKTKIKGQKTGACRKWLKALV
jgi:hypothetical protein